MAIRITVRMAIRRFGDPTIRPKPDRSKRCAGGRLPNVGCGLPQLGGGLSNLNHRSPTLIVFTGALPGLHRTGSGPASFRGRPVRPSARPHSPNGNSMTRILQLTDLHVFADADAQLQGIPTRVLLQQVVDQILQTEPAFDYVIVTGDHTHDESPAAYQAVREILAPWADRLLQVSGNHDDRPLLQATFPGIATQARTPDCLSFCQDTDHWRLIGLDTHVPGEVPGRVETDQLQWLQLQLQQTTKNAVALLFHHPPVDTGSEWMDAIGLDNREALCRVVQADDRIRLICCGHVHHEFEFSLAQAKIYTTPSTGIQFDPSGSVPRFATAAPGYRIIELSEHDFATRVVRLPTPPLTPLNN